MQGKHYERRFLPIAQGFMVEGAAAAKLIFHNKQRIFKKEEKTPILKQATKKNTDSKTKK